MDENVQYFRGLTKINPDELVIGERYFVSNRFNGENETHIPTVELFEFLGTFKHSTQEYVGVMSYIFDNITELAKTLYDSRENRKINNLLRPTAKTITLHPDEEREITCAIDFDFCMADVYIIPDNYTKRKSGGKPKSRSYSKKQLKRKSSVIKNNLPQNRTILCFYEDITYDKIQNNSL